MELNEVTQEKVFRKLWYRNGLEFVAPNGGVTRPFVALNARNKRPVAQ